MKLACLMLQRHWPTPGYSIHYNIVSCDHIIPVELIPVITVAATSELWLEEGQRNRNRHYFKR